MSTNLERDDTEQPLKPEKKLPSGEYKRNLPSPSKITFVVVVLFAF